MQPYAQFSCGLVGGERRCEYLNVFSGFLHVKEYRPFKAWRWRHPSLVFLFLCFCHKATVLELFIPALLVLPNSGLQYQEGQTP